jgi:hypothetical protein
MFAGVFSVITPCAGVGIVPKFEDSVELVFKTFLRPKNIKIVKPNERFDHFLSMRPGVETVAWRVQPQIISGNVHLAFVLCENA